MVEVALQFVGAYLVRKAGGLLGRAGADADEAFTGRLNRLYDWVKGKLTGGKAAEASLRQLELDPASEDSRVVVADHLERVVASDPKLSAELAQLVAELQELQPKGIDLEGWASAKDVSGVQAGVDIEGELQAGDHVLGVASASEEVSGEQSGIRYRPGQ